MKYLFWNTYKKNLDSVIYDIVTEYPCDVISIAEYNGNIRELIFQLNRTGVSYYKVNDIGNERITIITKFKPLQIEDIYDVGYFTIKKCPHDTLGTHIIAFVHFPSQGHTNNVTPPNYRIAQRLKSEIERVEKEQKCDKTIIIGDFNMNPYEAGMMAASALHCLSSREIVKMQHRVVLGEAHSMFYNPMWNLMGDIDLPNGTYFYDASSQEVNYYWNFFDQVVLRPSLIEFFDPSKVKLIYKTKTHDFITEKGRPNKTLYSDHLPLYFEL